MEKERHSQLELFSESKSYSELKTQTNHSLSTFIKAYEKTILIIIGFIITSIVSFSLGVEKGKKLIVNPPILNQAIDKQPDQPTIDKQNAIKQPQPKEEKTNKYTIQLASYKTKTHAEREAARLKKKGISPLVLSKGSYIIVCVGNFSDKEAAKSVLSEFKRNYHDCFVRKL